MSKQALELWRECQDELRSKSSSTQYATFFEPIGFESYDGRSRTLVLSAPSEQIVEFLETRFAELLVEVMSPRFGQITLQWHVGASPTDEKHSETKSEKPPMRIATNLNRSYTFNTYVEGESNKLARSVGVSIAEHPKKAQFNPLFVYGPSGCGKTHLISAIGNKVCELFPKKRVLYVSAREFQRQYTQSVVENKNNDFIRFYQQFDMLIVDDVQEWQTIKTFEAFFHIFNNLFMNGRRIILAADRTPKELKTMDERMLSRFVSGMLAPLDKPNYELCVDIMRAKIKRDGLVIPDNIVEYVARSANGSVRELEGVITSLLAYSSFIPGEIDMKLAEQVVGRIKHDRVDKVSADRVIEVVCEKYGITRAELTGQSRKKEIVSVRQLAMYLLQDVAKMNVNSIGRLMGGRNHSTVIHSIAKIGEQVATDKQFANEIKELEI